MFDSVADKVKAGADGKVRSTLSAEDWQLYANSMDCKAAAEALNAAFNDAVAAGKGRAEVHDAVEEAMSGLYDFGAGDSEPAHVLHDALEAAFGPEADNRFR